MDDSVRLLAEGAGIPYLGIDSALEVLNDLLTRGIKWSTSEESELRVLERNLEFLEAFLDSFYDKDHQGDDDHDKWKHLAVLTRLVIDCVESELENLEKLTDKSTVRETVVAFQDFSQLKKYMNSINVLKNRLRSCGHEEKKMNGSGTHNISCGVSRLILKEEEEEERVVGFEDEAMAIIERLASSKKKLDVVSIVGMAGIGKTTLAKRVYNDPFIIHHFSIRGWTTVSHFKQKRELLADILRSIYQSSATIDALKDEELGEELYKNLKGKKYIIVLDDVWNVKDWNQLKLYFPNDNNESRVLLTTRLMEVASQIRPFNDPHALRFLRKDESWDLLQYMVFKGDSCPLDLKEIGKQIAERCSGLPITIVVVAGILKYLPKTKDYWGEVETSVTSLTLSATELVGDVLDMSYRNLPHHLKLCFLYLGAFSFGYDVNVETLTCFWMAEGLIKRSLHQRCEDIAENYLLDLVNRSLVLVDQRDFDGRLLQVHLHDLVHDFCIIKAEDRNLFPIEEVTCPNSNIFLGSCRFYRSQFTLCDYPDFLIHPFVIPFFFPKNLRVLILSCDEMKFPHAVLQLVHIRYLKLVCVDVRIPPQISNLPNLETLSYKSPHPRRAPVVLPYTMWKLKKLRHIHILPHAEIENPSGEAALNSNCFILDNLQTFASLHLTAFTKSLPEWDSLEKNEQILSSIDDILARTPCLRVLSLQVTDVSYDHEGLFDFPNLAHLDCLETLMIEDTSSLKLLKSAVPEIRKFPPSLKGLILAGGRLDWQQGTFVLGMLPNLESLILQNSYFEGLLWETSEGGFLRLRFLKLSEMNLKKWITCSTHFPCLQELVVQKCFYLEEIPTEFGDVPKMQMIRLLWPIHSAALSLVNIQKEQISKGNYGLKIHIYPPFEEDYQEILQSNVT